jgi:crotonobetainyl-CoA:carnitine CoA-transferase CaiB-like acyl-CoA transferase
LARTSLRWSGRKAILSGGDAYGPTFLAYNRNKRSIVLDLTAEQDREVLLQLIDRSDVLIDNFRPNVLGKLGLAPDFLRKRNPGLIQCSITGFGGTGPYRDRPAFDAVGSALSGVASLFIDPQNPEAFGPTISDNVTGMQACVAILAALVERGRTGRGRRIEVNMLEATMAFAPDAFTNFTRAGVIPERLTRVATSQSFAFRCADDRALAIHLSTREKFWEALLDAMEAQDLRLDVRFTRHLQRAENYIALRDELARRFLARPRSEWLHRLSQADVPAAPVWNVAEAIDDSQVQALGSICETRHPSEGTIRSIHCPFLVDGDRSRPEMMPPPLLGQHTQEVLAEISGLG